MTQLLSGLTGLRGFLRRRTPPGSAPGTLSVDPAARRTRIRIMAYGPDRLIEEELDDPGLLPELVQAWPVVWVDVDGLADVDKLRQLGEVVGLHPLALEDAVGCHQRPKVERYPEHDFIVVRMVSLGERIATEQLSIFLSRSVVVTLQGERPGDSLEPVRERVRVARGLIREAGPDYLAYALTDAVIDHYFPVLEELGEQLEQLEEDVVAGLVENAPGRIHAAKHDLLAMRRALWPLREAIAALYREDSPQVAAETRVYLRDCHDHVVQLMDIVDTYREVAGSLMEIHLSSVSNRMNEVMKLLTIIGTVFIPLTFIAGLYGMNFDPSLSWWNMPELRWQFGYPFSLLLMAVAASVFLLYFRRRGWI
jgi:magnesium transporter